MINFIGIDHHNQWLALAFSQLHWYRKEVPEGRKVEHINLTHPDKNVLIELLQQAKPHLTEDFYSGLAWAMAKLK